MAKTKHTSRKIYHPPGFLTTRHGIRPLAQATLQTPRSVTLSIAARASLTALIKELKATDQQVQDLKTTHEKELALLTTGHQREIFELEDGHARELGEQEDDFDVLREETEEELEDLRCELAEKKDEINDLEATLRITTAAVERLEKELMAEKTKDVDAEKKQQETSIQTLERELAHEKAKNTELAKAKTQLDKVQKQWANMARLFSGHGQRMDVGADGAEEMQTMPKNEEDKEDEDNLTIIES